MKNIFYNEFDFETLETGSDLDYRTIFQRERDRIIHSAAFRRLQAKTQVFLPGEYDFYRTRLTHTIEVAQIGRSICHFLRQDSQYLSERFFIDPDLIEAICLAHDLGHPPFGHSGERTLNNLMKPYGGFEGNAQTLRMICENFYFDHDHWKGMNPSRALIDGILKYKSLFGELSDPENHFLYDYQQTYLNFVFFGEWDSLKSLTHAEKNEFRSVECQIMDWADDTAYSLNDIVDGINAGFITPQKIEVWAQDKKLDSKEEQCIEELLKTIQKNEYEKFFARKIGEFIRACTLEQVSNHFSARTNRYKYRLVIEPEILKQAGFLQKLAKELIFQSRQLHQLDHKWNVIISQIFDAFNENYLSGEGPKFKLLSDNSHRAFLREKEDRIRARLICDEIAGMTDAFVIRTHKRLFDPDYSSIVDLV